MSESERENGKKSEAPTAGEAGVPREASAPSETSAAGEISDADSAAAVDEIPPGDGVPVRSVVRRATRVPIPRRLLSAALLFGILAAALNALPRPFQPIPSFLLYDMKNEFTRQEAYYRSPAPEGEARVPGQALASDRTAYASELWRYAALGITREFVIRLSAAAAALCLFGTLLIAGFRRWRDLKAAARNGARLEPELLHRERLTPRE